MTCECNKGDNEGLIAEAVKEITAQAVAAATEAMTAAATAGDERLVTLEARIADLESALANIVASEVKAGDL